jgi:UDP-N-acetylmuramate dehydrogenase
MMPAARADTGLIGRLPPVRGRYVEAAPLAPFAWFRVGGPAEVLFHPADMEDLAGFLAARPDDVAVTVLGGASNVLIRDGGIPGVVIRLGRVFAGVQTVGTTVDAGAAAMDVIVARAACRTGIGGLEFLSGIPGTIGGALRMNAGAFGSDMAAVVQSADALDERGNLHRLGLAELGFGYRKSAVAEPWIFVAARLHGEAADAATVARRIDDIRAERDSTQPLSVRTGGSTFANPPGRRAWELIAAAGCRGLRRGAAMVSEKHCNFLINLGGATAAEIEGLGEDVRRRVFETSGVRLEWEIRRLGAATEPGLRGVKP